MGRSPSPPPAPTVEARYLDWLRTHVPADPRVEVGIGDDAAVLRPPAGRRTVAAVDMLAEGVDFLLGPDATPERVGHKALAVNLSDLAAMAARPEAALVAVTLPREGAEALAHGLFAGIERLAARHGVALVGGDTNTWQGGLVISVTVLGSVLPGRAWRRDGARPGDLLVVTGPCGGSLLGRHLDVRPRCDEALAIAERHVVHAAIDVSDGLSLDLSRLLAASRVRGVIDPALVPIHDDARRRSRSDADGTTPLDHALGDGEDFELILAMPPADAAALVASPPGEIRPTIVGRVEAGSGLAARGADGVERDLEPRGWIHGGT